MENDHALTTRAALLIIDMQQALCTGPYAMFETASLIARINRLSGRARSAALPVVIVQHEEAGGPLTHGSSGWQLASGLTTESTDIRVSKTASDAFHHTSLHASLQALGVEQLVVCGMQTEFCVDTTVRRALALGYPVTLVADGHSTMDSRVLSASQIIAHHNETLSHLDSFGPSVGLVPAAEVRFER